MSLKAEFDQILDWIPENTKLLDLGCGHGELLSHLLTHKNVSGCGLEMDEHAIVSCMARGVSVIQADLNATNLLTLFEPQQFDVVVMTQTLQAMQSPDQLIDQMLTIGKRAVVTFPNFGYWRNRLQVFFGGRMPVSASLPHTWYNTPNTHLCTFADFEGLCQSKNIHIIEQRVSGRDAWLGSNFAPNWFGEVALYHIEKGFGSK
jgi:methionine biosynthesis protein MetW